MKNSIATVNWAKICSLIKNGGLIMKIMYIFLSLLEILLIVINMDLFS